MRRASGAGPVLPQCRASDASDASTNAERRGTTGDGARRVAVRLGKGEIGFKAKKNAKRRAPFPPGFEVVLELDLLPPAAAQPQTTALVEV